MRIRSMALFLFLTMNWLTGCKNQPVEKFVTVEGLAKVDGRLLTTGSIGFIPDDSQGNKHVEYGMADIGPDGKFTLATNDKKGVRPGWYKVVVWASAEPIPAAPVFDANGQLKPIKWLTAAKYANKDTTDFRIEVVENPAPNAYELNFSPP